MGKNQFAYNGTALIDGGGVVPIPLSAGYDTAGYPGATGTADMLWLKPKVAWEFSRVPKGTRKSFTMQSGTNYVRPYTPYFGGYVNGYAYQGLPTDNGDFWELLC